LSLEDSPVPYFFLTVIFFEGNFFFLLTCFFIRRVAWSPPVHNSAADPPTVGSALPLQVVFPCWIETIPLLRDLYHQVGIERTVVLFLHSR